MAREAVSKGQRGTYMGISKIIPELLAEIRGTSYVGLVEEAVELVGKGTTEADMRRMLEEAK